LALALAAIGAGSAHATVTGYTDFDEFQTALGQAGLAAQFHNFDVDSNGDPLPQGVISASDTINDITFQAFVIGDGNGGTASGISPYLSGQDAINVGTTPLSGDNQIASTDAANAYQFLDGTSFIFEMPSTQAFGLYVLSAEQLVPGDFQLEFAGLTQDNGTTAPQGFDYFIGVIDTDVAHISAVFTAPSNLDFDPLFTLDNFVTAAPLPATPLLTLLGLGMLAWTRRR